MNDADAERFSAPATEDPEEHSPSPPADPEEFDVDDPDPELAGRGKGQDVEEIDDAWIPTAETTEAEE